MYRLVLQENLFPGLTPLMLCSLSSTGQANYHIVWRPCNHLDHITYGHYEIMNLIHVLCCKYIKERIVSLAFDNTIKASFSLNSYPDNSLTNNRNTCNLRSANWSYPCLKVCYTVFREWGLVPGKCAQNCTDNDPVEVTIKIAIKNTKRVNLI